MKLPVPEISHPDYAVNKQKQLAAKRLTDICFALLLLVFFAPLMVLIALAIKLDSSGPVLFRQRRVGLNGNLFEILKFRTMLPGVPDLATDQMVKLPSPVTKVGTFLRATSLDELPQLFNVLSGEMSIVGPRPALYNQAELTAKRQAAGILSFPPGITGWAQVNGRDELSDDVKVAYDKWYCANWHYLLDWKIIFSTFAAVMSRKGAF